jgi:hypothetical protein
MFPLCLIKATNAFALAVKKKKYKNLNPVLAPQKIYRLFPAMLLKNKQLYLNISSEIRALFQS